MFIIFLIAGDEEISAYYKKAFDNIDDAMNYWYDNYESEIFENSDSIINLNTSIFVIYDNLDTEHYTFDEDNNIFDYIREHNRKK